MGDSTIEWCDKTWNPVRGCAMVSPGCSNCYAMRVANRFSGKGQPYEGLTRLTAHGPVWTGRARFVPDKLADPLRWRKPAKIFVNSMSDLFHDDITPEQIAAVFGVMAACPQHTFMILTKRPKRMVEWFELPDIAKKVDTFKHVAIAGRIGEVFAPEREKEIAGFPGYYVTSRGRILTSNGSDTCLLCGAPNVDAQIARAKFCSKRCSSKASYERKMGRWAEPAARKEMRPEEGDSGHSRVMLYRPDGSTDRPLIHRLVLEAFDRQPMPDEQGCHIDGNATNNALWNLRWGSQSSNWDDRRRHGNGRSWSKLSEAEAYGIRERYRRGLSVQQIANSGQFYGRITETQVRHIVDGEQWKEAIEVVWPLPQVWLGVSVENQAAADERIPLLLNAPAAVRWVSAEPLLGSLDLSRYLRFGTLCECAGTVPSDQRCDGGWVRCNLGWRRINWVVCGCESGTGARPMDLDWARSLRDQCVAAKVPFFLKQAVTWEGVQSMPYLDGKMWAEYPGASP